MRFGEYFDQILSLKNLKNYHFLYKKNKNCNFLYKRINILDTRLLFNRHKNDIKKTWSLINETLNRNLKKQSTHEFLINDEMISDPIIIANKFNQYLLIW